MNETDKAVFGRLLAGVAELYGKIMSENLLEIYWQSLKKYPLSDLAQAVNQHVINPDSGQFMLKPADIVRSLEGRHMTQALRAWDTALAAVKQIGRMKALPLTIR